MESTQERNLNGLIELWVDIYSTEEYCVQGKAFTTRQLKPYVKAAFSEPCPSVYSILEADPQKAEACAIYVRIPARVRRNVIVQNLIRKELKDNEFLFLFDRLVYLAAGLNIILGITFVEAERRLKQSFKRMLSRITLRQLLSEPSENDIPSEFLVHTWLSSLPLPPASIAGANIRLRYVLRQQLKTFSSDMRCYEQDVKAALWECWNGRHIDECLKMLHKQGNTTEQMAKFYRILHGQEPTLLRSILLRMLRKTIEEIPEIHQEIRRLQTLDRELPLTEETLATLPPKHNQYETALDNLLDLLSLRKVDISHLDTRSLNLLNEELNRDKFGMSRRQYYGQDEDRIKQQFKRLSDKLKAEAG